MKINNLLLKELMQREGLSIKDISIITQSSYSYAAGIIQGTKNPGTKFIFLLAQNGFNIHELIGAGPSYNNKIKSYIDIINWQRKRYENIIIENKRLNKIIKKYENIFMKMEPIK